MPNDPSPQLHLVQACHFLGLADEAQAAAKAAERLGAEPGLLDAVRRRFLDEAD